MSASPDSDPLDNPAVIYRENRTQIEHYLRESNSYRLSGLLTRLAYYGFLFAIVNAVFAPFTADNLQQALIASALLGILFFTLYAFGRHIIKRQRLTAAAQIGYSWETHAPQTTNSN